MEKIQKVTYIFLGILVLVLFSIGISEVISETANKRVITTAIGASAFLMTIIGFCLFFKPKHL